MSYLLYSINLSFRGGGRKRKERKEEEVTFVPMKFLLKVFTHTDTTQLCSLINICGTWHEL
jgi:hypothetical protein